MVILPWNSTSTIPSSPSFYNSYRDSRHKLHHNSWKHIVLKNEIFYQIFTVIFSRNSWLYVLVSFVLAEIFPQFYHKICISLIFSILFSILQSYMRNVSVSHAYLHSFLSLWFFLSVWFFLSFFYWWIIVSGITILQLRRFSVVCFNFCCLCLLVVGFYLVVQNSLDLSV